MKIKELSDINLKVDNFRLFDDMKLEQFINVVRWYLKQNKKLVALRIGK